MKQMLGAFFLLCFLFTEPEVAHGLNSDKGNFVLGGRSTASAFGNSGYMGIGAGGHFRIHFLDRLGSEWFLDMMTTDIGGLAIRKDYHIGWSILFYVMNKSRFWSPYLIAGHCFDYTDIAQLKHGHESQARWSSAAQVGVGNHFQVSNSVDVSFSIQYMIHLGDDLHAGIEEVHGEKVAHIEKHPLSLEGHLLFTLSLNYRVAKWW